MGVFKTIFLIVVIFLVVYLIYNYFQSNHYHLSGLQSGTKSTTVKASKLPVNKGSSNYAYSIWFYIDNWQYKLSSKKEILTRAGNSDDVNPRITLAPYENNLNIDINTYPPSSSASSSNTHSCAIRNIPLQKWVNLIISLNGRALDVYIDGKLVRTCLLPNVAKVNPKANVHITPNGGFHGWTSNFQYFPHALNPQEAYNIYKKGYGGGGVGDIFNKYKIKVSYLVNNQEEGSFSI
jgi:hypothetical protein